MEKRERKTKRIFRGSATVEACVILPFLLVIFSMIIFVSFFLHNECGAWQCSYIAAMRADTVTGKTEKKSGLAHTFGKQMLNEQMLAASVLEISEKIQGKELVVYANGDTCTGAMPKFSENRWHFETKGRMMMLKPVQFIRRIRLTKDVSESIQENRKEETDDDL
ncbi:MAG: pilus assembly protein [Clostridiales bacterium]|nr:pilus assembly protein [Clostridiales bacterium]